MAIVQTFLQYLFFYIGLSHSSGIGSSIISGSITLFQMMLAHFMYTDDKMTSRKILSVLLGFSGICLYFLMQGGTKLEVGFGEICMLVAMFFSASGNILSKNLSGTLSVLTITTFQMLFGEIGLIAVGAAKNGIAPFHFSLLPAIVLGYLSLVSSVSFLLWNGLMKYNKAGSISVFIFLVPIFGVILSSVLLKEKIEWFILPALFLVVLSIILTNWSSNANNLRSPLPGIPVQGD